MNEEDRHRFLTHRRCHALHVSRADVGACKHAGKAGLQHLRGADESPPRIVGRGIQILPSENEPLVIESNAACSRKLLKV
jgi:hypothetical protein